MARITMIRNVNEESKNGGLQSTVDSIVASCPAAPGLILNYPKFVQKIFGTAEIYQQQSWRADIAKLNC